MLLACHTVDLVEAGCDEAGRGCLAGDVFAAAVILPKNFFHPLLNDSKKLTKNQRMLLRTVVEQEAIAWAVATASPAEIDSINILKASILAMHRAISVLIIQPEFLLIDGNKFLPFEKIPHLTVVKGDGKYASIAAASILAKTHRDAAMERLDQEFPQYCWRENAGYPTAAHREAIKKFGLSPYHRRSFRQLPVGEQLLLEI